MYARVSRALAAGVMTHPVEWHIVALRENWSRLEDHIRRTFLLLCVVAAGFELAVRATIEDVSLFGIDMADISLPVVFLPSLFAYFAYDLISGAAILVEVARCHDALMREAYGPLYREDLHLQVGPHNFSLLADLRWRLRGRHKTRRERYLRSFTVFRAALVAVAVFLFEVYAIYRVAWALPATLPASGASRAVATLLSLALFVPCIGYAVEFFVALRTRLRVR